MLKNRKVLITAGPTREYWDPVRYLTNNSSGAMGIALAHEAARLGASVVLVLGPIPRDALHVSRNAKRETRIRAVPVVSAWDMYQAVKKHLPGTDYFVGAAAVVDYRPAFPLKQKIKRHTPSVTLRLFGNPDIIAMVGHLRKGRPPCVIGFALETDHVIENASQKLLHKHLDWIVANRESNMGQSKGSGTLLSRWGDKKQLPYSTKENLAKKIWQAVITKN